MYSQDQTSSAANQIAPLRIYPAVDEKHVAVKVKTYSDPSYISSGGQDPPIPRIYVLVIYSVAGLLGACSRRRRTPT